MSKCPDCQKDIGRVALVDLVFTWEPVKDELVETGWHKACYLSAQHSVQADGERAGVPERPKPNVTQSQYRRR